MPPHAMTLALLFLHAASAAPLSLEALTDRLRRLPVNARRAAGAGLDVSVTLGGAFLLREHVLDARYIPTE